MSPQSPALLDAAAQALIEARRDHRQIVPPDFTPASHEEVYAIQDRVAVACGPVAGWKVGARSPDAVPNCAPILGNVRPSPARFDPARMHVIGIESEVAFRIGRDLPPNPAGIPAAAALQAIESAHAAIEVVDTRIADRERADPLWLLADNQMNLGLVVGPAWQGWREHDWSRQPVQLSIDGATIEDKQGGLPSRDPLRLVAWLADHAVRHRGGLLAGQMITTGSWTGLRFVHAGARIAARFTGIGEASVAFER